ncbi:hypothetical protein XENTR_v10010322 [Xenopus tropicalis]|nr:hypothetical protein XENTR_v10010322 [Xenopus tropicalis]
MMLLWVSSLVLLCGFPAVHGIYNIPLISVPNGGKWGSWGAEQRCPNGFVAKGFSVKEYGDDTAANNIMFKCSDARELEGSGLSWGSYGPWSQSCYYGICGLQTRVEEKQRSGDDTALNDAKYGNWSPTRMCPFGYLTGFSLRVEPSQGRGDDTAANNVKFRCSDNHELEGSGLIWGTYGPWSPSCQYGICGLKTKVEGSQGKGDDTTLNDVQFFCCDCACASGTQ